LVVDVDVEPATGELVSPGSFPGLAKPGEIIVELFEVFDIGYDLHGGASWRRWIGVARGAAMDLE
jgi:hypothetical protein